MYLKTGLVVAILALAPTLAAAQEVVGQNGR